MALGLLVGVGTADPLPPWAQYGILGLLVVGFLTRQIVPGWLYRATVRERDGERDESRALAKQINDILPTLIDNNRQNAEVAAVLRQLALNTEIARAVEQERKGHHGSP